MIGPSVQQKVDPLHTEMAEVKRLIGIQDELTITGLCKGIDTTESEGKPGVPRISLEGRRRSAVSRQAQSNR
jgi:hypothetical protein